MAGRRLDLLVDDAELAQRGPTTEARTGFERLRQAVLGHVTQAELGCDFDFLERRVGVAEPVIH